MRGAPDVIILAIPRWGVPVGYEIAQALHVPLDLLVVRKLGVPGHEELAMGAIASGGIRVLPEIVIQALGLSAPTIDRVSREEENELLRREHAYRGQRRRLLSKAELSCWWMTGWRRDPRCGPPLRLSVNDGRHKSSSQST